MQRLLAEFSREAQEKGNLLKSLLSLHVKAEIINAVASAFHLWKQQNETLVSELKTLE